MKTIWIVLALALSSVAQASPRRAVVSSGDCKDAELSGQAKAFYDALHARTDEDVLTADAFAERLFPQPSGSFEDIRRQFEAAESQFYEARYPKAAQAIDEVLLQIARLPPGDARWKLYVDAQLLRGLNFRSMGKVQESDAAFLNVLRLDPKYPLDPDYFTPSTRQAFEKLRWDSVKGRRVKLSVKSTLPASDIYLDGLRLGQTPLSLDVPAGTYELSLRKGDASSFTRQILVQGKETPVLVDLAYEGAVSATPFPCLASSNEDERVLSHAVRLGGTLGVEEVIVVRMERASSGPKWLAATVLNVEGGQKLREGGFKTQGLDAPAESLIALVDFVTTGKAQPNLVVLKPDSRPPWDKPAEADAARSSLSQEASLLTTPTLLPGDSSTQLTTAGTGPTHPLRVASYVTVGAGAATLGAAGLVRLSAQQDFDALKPYIINGRIDASDARAMSLYKSLVQKANLLNGLLIGSGALLAAGTALYLLAPEPPPVSLGVTPTSGGAAATLSGTF